jgi:hypothetical protein
MDEDGSEYPIVAWMSSGLNWSPFLAGLPAARVRPIGNGMVRGETGKKDGGAGRKGDSRRAERLRAALRENLKRRKSQARVRSQAESTGSPQDSAGFVPDKPKG